jgi:hypothetical protein
MIARWVRSHAKRKNHAVKRTFIGGIVLWRTCRVFENPAFGMRANMWRIRPNRPEPAAYFPVSSTENKETNAMGERFASQLIHTLCS